jgi:Ca-activated chloride channel homolog
VLLSSQWLFGQYTPPKTRILFVFDASQSMYASWQTGSKMDVAQRLMSEMLDSLERVPNQNF